MVMPVGAGGEALQPRADDAAVDAERHVVPAERQLRIRAGDERHVMLDARAHDAEIDEDHLRRAESGGKRLCEMYALDTARSGGVHCWGRSLTEGAVAKTQRRVNKKAAPCGAAFRERCRWRLVADRTAPRLLAGAGRVDHEDRLGGELLEVLRFERRRVRGDVVEDRSVREERRATLVARGRDAGRIRRGADLLDDDEVVVALRRVREQRREVPLDVLERRQRDRRLRDAVFGCGRGPCTGSPAGWWSSTATR